MTGFERASIALIYNLYYARVISTGKPIVGMRFTVSTYDENNSLKRQRYFKVREVSKNSFDIEWEEQNRYKIYNSTPLHKHSCTIQTEEREHEKIEVEALDSSYTTGLSGKYRFKIQHYSYTSVTIRDEEFGKTYRYEIVG